MKPKKPTIKELSKVVFENRQGLDIAFRNIEESRGHMIGLDKILDWYIQFKGETDAFKEYIEKEKVNQDVKSKLKK